MAIRTVLAAFLLPVFLLAAAQAESPAVPSAAGETGEPHADKSNADTSPWEHDLWNGATTMMRVYICAHARRAPTWCAQTQVLPSNVPLPDEQGPPLTAEDAAWLAFLEQTDPADLSLKEVAFIKRRALDRRDTQAMEILGYLYAQGVSVKRDYAEAYRWYGRAFLAGEKRVRPNLDLVWGLLQRYDLEAAVALTREFNALKEGELMPAVEAQGDPPLAGGQAPVAQGDPTGL
ncbi:SEL1-like repeat protein [Pelagibius litoralis]|uniref:SEL1-like repeat protein n=1 Tax=Pelagibius litoralis TaxID=374515 RepID=A0A967C502_9PROT|nr:SEL1-like repeat protein [Pelagibius litoralis]NIA68980.1 SEL1-like repeat protein [Pelagibius litoralis]